MTQYEQGRHDATISILSEFRKFKFGVEGREKFFFDEADIIISGCEHCRKDKHQAYLSIIAQEQIDRHKDIA